MRFFLLSGWLVWCILPGKWVGIYQGGSVTFGIAVQVRYVCGLSKYIFFAVVAHAVKVKVFH